MLQVLKNIFFTPSLSAASTLLGAGWRKKVRRGVSSNNYSETPPALYPNTQGRTQRSTGPPSPLREGTAPPN